MLKRVSAFWMPLALALLFVGYWAGRQSPPRAPRASGPAVAEAEPDAKSPSPGTPVEPATAPGSAISTTGFSSGQGIGEPSTVGTARDTGAGGYEDTWRAAGDREPSGGTSMTPGRSLADETDPGWDEPADTTTTQPSDYRTDYGTTTGGTTSGYGTGTDTGYGTGTTSGYGTGTSSGYGTATRVTDEGAFAFHLFDGFERGNSWAVESAADHADLTLAQAEERNLQGARALKAVFKAYGKGNFELRREVNLDLTDATAVKVDVVNEAGPMDLALGVRAGHDTTLFTTPPKPLVQGLNQDVTFSLRDLASQGTSTFGSSWTWSRDSVSRISLIFQERDQKEGTVYIDNLRFDRPAAKLGLKTSPAFAAERAVEISSEIVERFETLTLTVHFDADYQDFFDRTEIDVLASFLAPSGKRLEAHGFVADIDAETAKPVWKVRFTPDEVGLWRYDVTVKTAGGDTVSSTYLLTCQRKADRHGFIRRSTLDPTCFEFDDGSPYYPLGQNVCWASNYEHFLDKIQAYGGNYVRVWLCPWNLMLEDPREPGKLDLRVADALDALLGQCERRGVYMQLVLRHHGMHNGEWAKSPYNRANGGPCYSPGQFFTDTLARDQHKRFLDYVVARWAHSPALFAWELWNEVDLARADRDADIVEWHKEMAAYLKKIDPYRHLVTTSVASAGKCPELFKLPNIDFVPVHFYDRDVVRQIHDAYVLYRELRKPVFIGEFSGGHKPADDLADTQGVRLHAGLWHALVTPMAGSAMPWWWDTWIDKQDLYGHWAALAKFAKGIDRRGKDYEVVRSTIKVGEDASVSMQGLVAPSEAFLWVYDEGRVLRPAHAGRPLLVADRPVKLAGMLGGTFRIEVWDTYKGEILTQTTAESADGALAFTLPKCDRDIAVKILKEGEARPRLEW